MYVCAMSLMQSLDAKKKLALDIANFNLNLHDKQNDVGNIKIYACANFHNFYVTVHSHILT